MEERDESEKYVRYGEKVLIGIEGSRTKAKNTKKELTEYLKEELGLTWNTEIKSSKTKGAEYLGAEIRANIRRPTIKGKQEETKERIVGMKALAPIEQITKRLAEEGMCKIENLRRREVKATRKTA